MLPDRAAKLTVCCAEPRKASAVSIHSISASKARATAVASAVSFVEIVEFGRFDRC